MNEKTIKEVLRKGERVTLECKRAKVEVPKSVWATNSTFANTIGGLTLHSVDENMQKRNICKRYTDLGMADLSKRASASPIISILLIRMRISES